MTASAAAFTRSWPVGLYTATLTVPKPQPGKSAWASIEWAPSMPQRLSAADLDQYRAGRDQALRDMSRSLGLRTAVVEL